MAETHDPQHARRLAAAVIPPYALEVLRVLNGAGAQAFLVGGCVRDLLRGIPPKDYDVCSSALPERVLELFPHTVATGLKHGTVTVVQTGGSVEVTTFRGEEGYGDGRRPDRVVFHDSIEADLARRDFTINAMAFDPARQALVDPFGGAADLADGRVRCVGSAAARFGEDGLRALRAVRFAGVLRFEVEPDTLAAIPGALATYARVAIERVTDELRKLLRGPRPSRALRLLVSTGLADRILPALSVEPELDLLRRLTRVNFVPPRFALRMAALFRGHVASLESLKLPNATRVEIELLDRGATPPSSTDLPGLRRYASQLTAVGAREALKLVRAEALARQDTALLASWRATRQALGQVLAANPPLSVGDLALNGNEVSGLLGVRGPQVGKALRDLLEAVLQEPDLNTAERLRKILLP